MEPSESYNKENIRDHIINIARGIFSKFGFNKTTVEDIAKGLGKGKSSIYYYFKSKEEIYEEVLNKEANTLRNEIYKKVLNTNDNPKTKLRNYVLIRMRYLFELTNFNEALRNDYLKNFAFVERLREKYDREEHSIILDILQEGMRKDIFRLQEAEFVSMAFLTAMKGLEVSLFIKKEYSIENLEERLDEMLEIIFYGLVKNNK
ncbi:MAG: TetR/AcrR family transcriptional regulator [Bacteroidales bacterium]